MIFSRKGPHIEVTKKILSYSRKDFFSNPNFFFFVTSIILLVWSTIFNDDIINCKWWLQYLLVGTPLLDSNGQ